MYVFIQCVQNKETKVFYYNIFYITPACSFCQFVNDLLTC